MARFSRAFPKWQKAVKEKFWIESINALCAERLPASLPDTFLDSWRQLDRAFGGRGDGLIVVSGLRGSWV